MWQYIAVAGAGAGAEIIDKVRAGAKRQKKNNFGSATLLKLVELASSILV